MLTIFSCPKPFYGHSGVTQWNAIKSWTLLEPKPDVILMGAEAGTADAAHELGLHHIPSIQCNDFGTPLVSSLFAEAETAAVHDILCYVNADIILLQDFMQGIERVDREKAGALMVGRRWNLDMRDRLAFDENWAESLRARVRNQGKLYPYFAIDYFVFPRGMWAAIPPFAIGRPAWDNWIIYSAVSRGIPVVDMTGMVTVVHQNHDYSHHPQGWAGAMKGEESTRNIELAGEVAHVHSLLDAPYALTRKGVRRRFPPYHAPFYLYRTLVVLSESHKSLKPCVTFIKRIGDYISSRAGTR
jgi:hypothetical protein